MGINFFKCEMILFCEEEKYFFDQNFDYKFDLKKKGLSRKKEIL